MKVIAAIAALVGLAVLPVIVLGHAELVSSDPTDGATITTPYTLTATFAEEFAPDRSSLSVENSAGVQVAVGTASADATEMTAQLPALPDGKYTVRWTTVTPDDNGVERGTYTFNVGSGSATPAPTAPPAGGTGSGSDILVALVIAIVLVGAVVVLVIIRGRR